jgi:hypothetical protein
MAPSRTSTRFLISLYIDIEIGKWKFEIRIVETKGDAFRNLNGRLSACT